MTLNNSRGRLRDIKPGTNNVSIVRKSKDGFWWEMFPPHSLYPISYIYWESAIKFAQIAGAEYSDIDSLREIIATESRNQAMIFRQGGTRNHGRPRATEDSDSSWRE